VVSPAVAHIDQDRVIGSGDGAHQRRSHTEVSVVGLRLVKNLGVSGGYGSGQRRPYALVAHPRLDLQEQIGNKSVGGDPAGNIARPRAAHAVANDTDRQIRGMGKLKMEKILIFFPRHAGIGYRPT
jgi:hypothetical protein